MSTSQFNFKEQMSGLTGRIAARKPLLTCQNKKKRLGCLMKHHQWTTEDWKEVLWTDESTFEISSSSCFFFFTFLSSMPKDGSSHEGKSLMSEAVLLDPGLVSERQPEPKIVTAAFCSHLMCTQLVRSLSVQDNHTKT